MILIVGMGLTGITIADQIVKYTEHEVLMIERENHYGGLHYEYCEKDIIVNENVIIFFHRMIKNYGCM